MWFGASSFPPAPRRATKFPIALAATSIIPKRLRLRDTALHLWRRFPLIVKRREPKAHNTCTACGKNFAVDADAGDIAIEPVADADLTIEALGHAPVSVEAVIPTYDTAGNTAGTKCERCGDWLTAQFLPELKESVKFHYEITGVNGADAAVNSGYVTLNIYFDVLADAADKAEYGQRRSCKHLWNRSRSDI